MMSDFQKDLQRICAGRVGFLAIGNTDRSDDGAGMFLGQELRMAGVGNVFEGETTPERALPLLRDQAFDHIVFFDAVDMGLEPGTAAIFDATEIKSRFPQVSTHKLSLGTLAQLASDGNTSRVWLLGIQPKKIEMSQSSLTPEVAQTVRVLSREIAQAVLYSRSNRRESVCR